MPLRWEDLGKLKGADAFTLAAAMKRGAKRQPDPWKGYFAVKQELPKKAATVLPEPARPTGKGRGARAG